MRTRIMHQALAAALLLAGAAAAQPVFESHGDLGVTPKAGAFAYGAAKAEYRARCRARVALGDIPSTTDGWTRVALAICTMYRWINGETWTARARAASRSEEHTS